MKEVTKDTYKDEIKEGNVMLVISKDNCPNCTQTLPVVETLSKDPNIKTLLIKTNSLADVPAGFQFNVFPGIFTFKDGQFVRGYCGRQTIDQLKMAFGSPLDLRLQYSEAMIFASIVLDEIKNYNRGISYTEQKEELPTNIPTGDPNEDACEGCV